MAEPGSSVSNDVEHSPQLRQCDRHPDATRCRAHQDPPIRPRPHIQRGKRLQRSKDRQVPLTRHNQEVARAEAGPNSKSSLHANRLNNFSGKEACFDRVIQRFGRKSTYVVIGK